jgi:AcrR family transcriptional regulator
MSDSRENGGAAREVRVPVQERSRMKMEEVLSAAHALFLERGYDAVGLRDIAKRAGVSIGTVYAYFSDKRELFIRAIEARGADIFREIREFSPDSHDPDVEPERAVRDIITASLRLVQKYQVLLRDIMVLSLTDETFRAAYAPLERTVADATLTPLFDRFVPPDADMDREAAKFVVHKAADEIIQYLVFYDVDIEAERVICELSVMIARYLTRRD